MQIIESILVATTAFALASAAGESSVRVNTTLSGLDINRLGETSLVSFANGSIWIGGIKSEVYSEPFLAQSGQGRLVFTSYHSVPTGWQLVYIYPNETTPVGLTVPHGGAIPQGASSSGFAFDDEGLLKYNGANKFFGCQTAVESKLQTYEIYWIGDSEPNGVSCIGPLYLEQDDGCSTIG
ncbi:MAG: hypothetical protein M1818_008134 [Claussenomyces sp. TS43310]|nr:MAG: hypothetical protein M1818_008134 [Claussenomyces sp. TS43310]